MFLQLIIGAGLRLYRFLRDAALFLISDHTLIASFVEDLASIPEFEPYLEKWLG